MRSLLTVSELALRGKAAERALRRWIADTAAFNAENGLTGGLIVARNLLADIVEGDPAAIEASLRRAGHARHHVDVTLADSRAVERRAFQRWKLLYQGSSLYVAKPIAALLDGQDAYHAGRVRCLMEAFADLNPLPPGTAGQKAIGEDWPRTRTKSPVPSAGR